MKRCSQILLLAVSVCSGLSAQQAVLWQPRANVDWQFGPGGKEGVPQPPFRFVSEESSGTAAKVNVVDALGRRYVVKFGPEAKPETFATRVVWGMGYHADPVYFVRSGTIRNARNLGKARPFIDRRGQFKDGRFEYRRRDGKILSSKDWTWEKNAFRGMPQLNGLKILAMLLANWDTKDGRDHYESNTAILERGSGPGRTWTFYVTDWGATMGKWGNYFTREKWDCEAYTDQNDEFVERVRGRGVEFGFGGKHADSLKDDITQRDVRWFVDRFSHISDSDLSSALLASGADAKERTCFVRAIRARVNRLQQAATVQSRSRRR